jgi:hypothetical protein
MEALMNTIYKQILSFFKQFGAKKIILFVLAFVLVLIISLSFMRNRSNNDFYATVNLSYGYDDVKLTDVYELPLYAAMRSSYERNNIQDTRDERTILTQLLDGRRINGSDSQYGDIAQSYISTHEVDDVLLLNDQNDITFTNPNPESGLYYLAIDYYELENTIENTQINIKVNGLTHFMKVKRWFCHLWAISS